MTYDECMKTFQIGTAYPLTHNRELETKKDKFGKTYKFIPNSFQILDHKTVRVWGQDKHEVWCNLNFKAKTLPKWLKRCMTDAQKQVQAKKA